MQDKLLLLAIVNITTTRSFNHLKTFFLSGSGLVAYIRLIFSQTTLRLVFLFPLNDGKVKVLSMLPDHVATI